MELQSGDCWINTDPTASSTAIIETSATRSTVHRRQFLAGSATAITAGLAGCVRRARNVVTRDAVDQLSVTITSVPADGDRETIQLARRFAETLEAVGIDAAIDMRSSEEHLRAILLNHDFECFVGMHPAAFDPDFLYEALHSRYAEEAGWQNPYGYTNTTVDELLERQRRATGTERREIVGELLETIHVERPFVPICRPEEIRLVRTDRFDGWGVRHPVTRTGYLGLDVRGEQPTLRAIVIDGRPSKNVNPLAPEWRDRGLIVDLMYDSLGTFEDETIEPWLAEDWTWTNTDSGDGSTVSISLREDVQFHDGTALTASDVEFTYRFLEDTSLGQAEMPTPAPRFRALADAVSSIDIEDETTITMDLEAGREVGVLLFTIPILPAHIWRVRTETARVPGIQIRGGVTEALVTDNVPAIGSGPYAFADRVERDFLALERYDNHFTRRADVDLPIATPERIRFDIDPRSASAIAQIEAGDADVTTSTLETYVIDDITESDTVQVIASPSWTFYQLGFNVRHAPFSNLRFRQVCARLLDAAWVVNDIFNGYAEPIASPVRAEWVPDTLTWNGNGRTDNPNDPFVESDGSIDVGAARAAFEAAGFTFDENGRLMVRE